MGLESKEGRKPSSTAGRKAFPRKDGALGTATESSRKAWNKTTAQFSLLCAAAFPWVKPVYLDESRVHPFSLLCQKEGSKTRENTGKGYGLDTSSDLPSWGPPVLSFSCSKWLLAVKGSRKGRPDTIQFIHLRLVCEPMNLGIKGSTAGFDETGFT